MPYSRPIVRSRLLICEVGGSWPCIGIQCIGDLVYLDVDNAELEADFQQGGHRIQNGGESDQEQLSLWVTQATDDLATGQQAGKV